MRYLILICLSLILFRAEAQKAYTASQYELIFSLGDMNGTAVTSKPVVRFTAFPNLEQQLHIDFGKTFGIYSGIGLRNVGIINYFPYNDRVTYKQRAYNLSIPLAFKLGSMKNSMYLALGGEAGLMVHYKEKFIFGRTKIKNTEWFSDKVNMFNPAVFFQLKFHFGQVLTVKYYLNDFLTKPSSGLTLPDGTVLPDYAGSSKLFYISYGSNIVNKRADEKIQEKRRVEIKSARLHY